MEFPQDITIMQFKEALGRYPELIKSYATEPKEGSLTLEELDSFRYVEAPASFSKNTGRTMSLSDVQKLVDWKIRHGVYRPSIPKLVASNTDEKVEAATKDAFVHYAASPDDLEVVIKKLADPLKGIGPATASLLLAVHDPDHVIFFSDEAYKWLCGKGEKVSIKYNVKEFKELFTEAKVLMDKLRVNPIDVEKVAFVLVKENEPVKVPKPPKEPSGRGRGRPAMSESEKKVKQRTVPARGVGRPRSTVTTSTNTTTPKKATGNRGRPKGDVKAIKTAKAATLATGGKQRGRPRKSEGGDATPVPNSAKRKAEATPSGTPAKKRGRPRKSET